MPSQAEPLPCHRCHRPVEVSRDQFDVFEHTHYVCFHTLASENDAFGYPIAGQRELSLTISKDPGGDEVTVRITGRQDRLAGARIAGLMDAFQ